MFYTGIFSMNGKALMTRHDSDDDFDDDVLSWIDDRAKKLIRRRAGYVSNTGTVATIHIKPKFNNEENIERVKKFRLNRK